MNQAAFDFDAPRMPPPMARKRDPGTSHAAAAQARDMQARHHRLILDALERHGAMGKDSIAARAGLTGVAVARRARELHRAGLIRPTGRTVQSLAGRAERVWGLV